ncbi:MAG: methyltransferase domain-containing protein [Candidatus Diapherotrites archaeon]|nr:methyltransferase domain-containing protein [Candidatus Diapherotrites archaeon]
MEELDTTHMKVAEMLGKPMQSPGCNARPKILDAGAGEGRLSVELKKRGFDVSACDILLENRFPQDIEYKRADLNEGIPYPDNYFDVVTCVELVEHLEDPWHLLTECNRVLKKGGAIVITTPNIINFYSRIAFLLKGRFFCFGPNEMRRGDHINPVTIWEIRNILNDTGFGIETESCNRKFGLDGIKKGVAFIACMMLSPFLSPKDTNLLRGEILIIKARKVKAVE